MEKKSLEELEVEITTKEREEKDRQRMIRIEYERKQEIPSADRVVIKEMEETHRQWQIAQKQKAKERYQKKKQLLKEKS